MLKQRRQENNLSEPDPKPGQRSPRKALQKKRGRRKTERGTTCPPLTKNTNHGITKEIRTENAATVKHFQKKK